MVRPVRVQAAVSDDSLFLRLRWASNEGTTHEAWHFTGGHWRREGVGFRDFAASLTGDPARGATDHTSASSEVVLSVALGERDPARGVRAFGRLGCFVACHDRDRQMPNWRPADGPTTMALLPGLGRFLDLWEWRAHRTAAAEIAADLSISASGREPDPGTSPAEPVSLVGEAPQFVFNPDTNGGKFAVPFEQLLGTRMSNGSLPGPRSLEIAAAVAHGYVPAEGDAVPAWRVRRPDGSAADVRAEAMFADGGWDLRLTRALDTGDADHDLALALGSVVDVAFALHSDEADGRDHYVSLPLALGLETPEGDVRAVRVQHATAGSPPDLTDETAFPVATVPLFLPGITSYEFVVGAILTRQGTFRADDVPHGGRVATAGGLAACADCHAVASDGPEPAVRSAGALERMVPRRGGVFGATPLFEAP